MPETSGPGSGSRTHPNSWPRLPSQKFVAGAIFLAPHHSDMARTKEKSSKSSKRGLLTEDPFLTKTDSERPSKKAKLLDESDDASDTEGGASLKVNEEYARRFEHNKKRAEQHRRMWSHRRWSSLY
jgi:hypothetical protein